MNAHSILWIYIILLVDGGLMGLLNGGSKVSLITAVAFAVPLILCNLSVIPFQFSTWILIGLLVVLAWCLTKSKKFMPSGRLLILTIFALASPHLLK